MFVAIVRYIFVSSIDDDVYYVVYQTAFPFLQEPWVCNVPQALRNQPLALIIQLLFHDFPLQPTEKKQKYYNLTLIYLWIINIAITRDSHSRFDRYPLPEIWWIYLQFIHTFKFKHLRINGCNFWSWFTNVNFYYFSDIPQLTFYSFGVEDRAISTVSISVNKLPESVLSSIARMLKLILKFNALFNTYIHKCFPRSRNFIAFKFGNINLTEPPWTPHLDIFFTDVWKWIWRLSH